MILRATGVRRGLAAATRRRCWLVISAGTLALVACTSVPLAETAPPAAPAGPAATAATATPASVPAARAADADAALQPEAASGLRQLAAGWTTRSFAVAAANPLATDAGAEILRAGGSALDAAVAVQMVLNLVEPQSSGIGGGAFLMHWDGRAVQAWDGRETAPAAADDRSLLDAQGRPLPHGEATFGGRAVATPGVVRMLEAAHREHGRLPWARLFDPAIALAERGFAISPRLHTLLQGSAASLRRDALARAHFLRDDGTPHPVGHLLRNPALAAVLRGIATQGSAAFYSGPVADDIVRRVGDHAVPGRLSAADLAAYAPLRREALCTDWRQIYRVCGMPPPSSGHLAMMQTLGLLDRLPGPGLPAPLDAGVPGAAWLHLYIEAARLAFADRAQYVADPAFVSAPRGDWASLLDDAYLRQRAALVGPQRAPLVSAGRPDGSPLTWAPMPEQPEHGTSHISVVDAQGNAIAMTTSVEAAFGARVMSDGGSGLPGGFLLNNTMTDFAAQPQDAQQRPLANRIEPGKRPRSSMTPTLVFDRRDGRFLMTLGSPLGAAIPHFTAKVLLATLGWGLDAQQAIALPNVALFNDTPVLERGRFPPSTLQALRERGHALVESDLTSGLQAIQRTPQGWLGGADPRREGVVRGD